MTDITRVCFRLRVDPARLEEYRVRHTKVWPEMRAALVHAGWRNYSLFLAADGELIGYLECESFDAAQAAMAATEVNAKWQDEMADFFVDLETSRADQSIVALPEVFHLS